MEHPLNGNASVGHTLGVAMDNRNDPNFDPSATVLEDESPYPEVRSAVSNTDDPNMPSSTVRSWVVGLILVVLLSGTNQFFYLRYPAVSIILIIALVLGFIICKAWARYLPNISVFGILLNPGPFTVKEHVIIAIMATPGTGSAYATNIISVRRDARLRMHRLPMHSKRLSRPELPRSDPSLGEMAQIFRIAWQHPFS